MSHANRNPLYPLTVQLFPIPLPEPSDVVPRPDLLCIFVSRLALILSMRRLQFRLSAARAIEMFSFLVLDIGLPVLYDYTNGWELFSDALLQSLSVRASGFGIVSISSLAPSVL